MNVYRPHHIVKRFVEVREREGDRTSRIICLIDFSAGVLITYHRGEKQVVLLEEEYRRWCEQYEPAAVDNEALTG